MHIYFVSGAYVMEKRSRCLISWLLPVVALTWLCTPSCADESNDPSPPPSHNHHIIKRIFPFALPVLGILLFIFFIYSYNKKYFGKKKSLKDPEIPPYFSSELKSGAPVVWSKDSESKEPNSQGITSEESFSGHNQSAEFRPPKLVFIEKDKPSPFKVEDLLRASAELLGQGSFGNLYKVVMEDGTVLVVKRLKDLLVKGQEFEQRMAFMGKLKHPNLLPLFAYCSSPDENLIIYKYQKSGSLSSLLDEYFSKQRELNWSTRLSIIGGVASGLSYMHQEFESQNNIAHGNLKPSNIILTEASEPYIADYGFNSLVEPGTTITPFSSNAYKAPERRITQKSDVYSFGMMLLELLTGKKADNGGFNLPRWVQSTVREEWTVEVFDKEMVVNAGENRIVALLQIGLNCVCRTPENRPTMSQVSDVIDKLWEQQDDYSTSSIETSQSSFHSITELPGGGISMATPSPIRILRDTPQQGVLDR